MTRLALDQIMNHVCHRHQLITKDKTKEHERHLKNDLKSLPDDVQQNILEFWTLYQKIPQKNRYLALDGILHYSCFPQLSYLSTTLDTLTKVDFVSLLPNEVSFRILNYLDATSLCRASQVSKTWKDICDNDVVWKRMCLQHINKKCAKCGWGLPLLGALKRKEQQLESQDLKGSQGSQGGQSNKRKETLQDSQSNKRQKTSCVKIQPLASLPSTEPTKIITRPWKHVYAERYVVARNWKKSQFSSQTLIGHTDAVMSIFFDEAQSLLITASRDTTLRAWNTDTGLCVAILKGHTAVVRGVQFDDTKVVSCSMDKTIRIWNRRTFECVRVIEGHTEGLVSIHFIDRLLASGAIDGVIRVWNLEAGCSFTLNGHRNWANKIKILPGKKQLLSCSDDNSMVLWDISTQTALHTFTGHVGPVQTLALMTPYHNTLGEHVQRVVTGALDHTIKIWDYNTGELVRTLFGHEEGVWSVDVDSIRIVSGSQDGTIKVWDIETGQCVYTIESHNGTVYSVCLSDTKLISADEHGIVTVRDFLKH